MSLIDPSGKRRFREQRAEFLRAGVSIHPGFRAAARPRTDLYTYAVATIAVIGPQSSGAASLRRPTFLP